MRHRSALTLAAATLALLSAGCSAEEKPPAEGPERSVQITKIVDRTRSRSYEVDTTVPAVARVRTYYGSGYPDLTFYLQISNVNQTVIEPVGKITYADGATVTCQAEDIRQFPSLTREFLEVILPCPPALRTEEPGTLTVTDLRR